MSYRSKRTRAEMTEADAPHVTKPSSLTSPSSDSSTIADRWGPFCPQKPQEPAVIKQRQLPSLNGSHLGANIDELCAPKAPVSKRQVIPTDAYKKIRQQAQVGVKPPNSVWKSSTATSDRSTLLSNTHTPAGTVGDLGASKNREISAKQLEPHKKTGEQAQVGVKPTNSMWKSSSTIPDPSSLLSNTHALGNVGHLAARKNQGISAKKVETHKKTGQQAEVGVKPTTTPDPSSLLSNTQAPENVCDLVARKNQEISAKQLEPHGKIGKQAQVGVKPTNSVWKSSTTKPDCSTLLSNSHGPKNSEDVAARKTNELSAKQFHASQIVGVHKEVGRVEPPNLLRKNVITNSERSFTTSQQNTKAHATPNLYEPATKIAHEVYAKQRGLSHSQPTHRPLSSENVGTTNNGSKTVDKSSVDPQELVLNQHDVTENYLKPFKPRRRSVVHDWPDNVEYDENEEVLTIDGEGNIKKVNDPIQPHDVWFAKDVRYCVTFNELHQPLKKGGHILVRFIGDIARRERFCPIRNINWHHVPDKFKVDIVKVVREHFVLPDGDGYDEGILKRVGKSVRQYRHYLKKTFFKPASKNREEIYQARPSAIPFDSWIHLVDYWYSDKGKKFAECGKEARASQNHVHTTGSISYANIRAEFEEKNKREPTELEVFMQTHKRKDGSYVKDTVTEEFMLDADTYIHNEVVTNPTKSKIQIQNEAFSKLMYAEQIPKRPLGYGFGVKSSEVFGVHGILRKEASKSGDSSSLTLQNMEKMQNMENAVVSLTKNNEELQTKLDKTNFILSKILEGMSSGISSPELAELAKSTLNSQGK